MLPCQKVIMFVHKCLDYTYLLAESSMVASAGSSANVIMNRASHKVALAFLVFASQPALLCAGDNDTAKRFLYSHCIRCHGPDKQEAKLALPDGTCQRAGPH